MIPIVAGLLMGAAMGGGIAALQKKDILQGALMGGIGGALGGAFMPAAGAVAPVAEGAAAGTGLAPAYLSPTGMAETGTMFAGGSLPGGGAANLGLKIPSSMGLPSTVASTGVPAGTGLTVPTHMANAVTTGGAGSGGISNFISANKYALAGGALGGMMAPGQEPDPADQGNIRDYTYSQSLNPEFGSVAGAPYFNQGYTAGAITPAEDYTAANGGIIALAEGGQALELAPYQPVEANRYSAPVRTMTPEVAAYNQQLMARANQQYNVNPRPLPIQVPGTAEYIASRPASTPTATSSDFIDQYYQQMLGRNADPTGRKLIEDAMKAGGGYDPARDIAESIRSSEEFKLSGKNANPTGIEIGKTYGSGKPSGYSYDPVTRRYSGGLAEKEKTELERMREEMDMMRNEQGGNSFASGDGGEANGGVIKQRYNVGGLSSLGDYSDGGRLLKGPGDGVSDDIPARIGARQPARLADGEFVVPARIVSEIGNGSTDAGAKRLYAMMDRVQKGRKKSVGKGKVAVDSKAHKMLPA
jgi:hypothetical protein